MMVMASAVRIGNRVTVGGRTGIVERTTTQFLPEADTVILGVRDSEGRWFTVDLQATDEVVVSTRTDL